MLYKSCYIPEAFIISSIYAVLCTIRQKTQIDFNMWTSLCAAILAMNLAVHAVPLLPSEIIDNLKDMKMVQSPIAISSRHASVEDDVAPLEFHGHWKKEGNATLYNSGTTAKVIFQGRSEKPYITGGPLKTGERYIFEQMHFHWAKKDKYGSEHTVNGETHSMEAHLVHYNEKYGDFHSALEHKDGLAVVAFFLQASGTKDDDEFNKIAANVPKIEEPSTKVAIDSDSLIWMSKQELSRHYYTYHGSLTTPPYNECVTWIVYQAPVYVSEKQVDVFRHIRAAKNHKRISGNSRHIQPIDGTETVLFARNINSSLEL